MITLQNKGLIDLELLSTMGAHVKEGGDSIGFFGTGLKYAIAVFLREGIDLSLWIGEKKYKFYTEKKEIRGKVFEMCYLQGPYDSIRLGFTTELGKNWSTWQSYREIHSNCLDEKGEIGEDLEPRQGMTTFCIDGCVDVEGTFLSSLDKTLLFESPTVDIYEGGSSIIYYKGIRAMDLHKPSLYTYNIKKQCQLTEDRLLCYGFEVEAIIANAVARMEDRGIIKAVVKAPSGNFESNICFGDYSSVEPGEEFKEEAKGVGVNHSIKSYIEEYEPQPEMVKTREDFLRELSVLCDDYEQEYEERCGTITIEWKQEEVVE